MENSAIDVMGTTESRAAFTCETAAIEAAAAFLARRIVSRRSTVPILACVHVAADPAGFVTLTGTNLDQWASVKVAADVDSPGAFCVDAQALAGVLIKARKARDCVRIAERFEAARIDVTIGCNATRLAYLPADDFPLPPTMEIEGKGGLSRFTVPAAQWLADMAMLAPCMPTEEARYYLRGVALQARELAERDRLVMVATDGKAICAASRPIPAGAATLPDAIIPDGAVHAMLKGAKLASGDMVAIEHTTAQFSYGEARGYVGERFRFDMGRLVIWSKAVDGTFPQWDRIFGGEGEGDGQPALFPELLPGVPLPTMEKLAKAVDGAIAWEGCDFGLTGSVDNDPDVILGTYRNPDGDCAKRGFDYASEHGNGEVIGPDGVAYPVAFGKDAIHFSAGQLRALIGESCFETMAITLPDGRPAHILKWLWEDGASRFLTVGTDGRTFAGGEYVTRAEIEAGIVDHETTATPVDDRAAACGEHQTQDGILPGNAPCSASGGNPAL